MKHPVSSKSTACVAHTYENIPRDSNDIFRQGYLLHFQDIQRNQVYFPQNSVHFIILSFSIQKIFTFLLKQAVKLQYPPRLIKGIRCQNEEVHNLRKQSNWDLWPLSASLSESCKWRLRRKARQWRAVTYVQRESSGKFLEFLRITN